MRLIILGAGGFGQVVRDLAEQTGRYMSIRFLDDGKTGPEILGPCGGFLDYADEQTEMYPAIGNNKVRMRWLDRLRAARVRVPTFVHDRAFVSPTAIVEPGSVILPMAVVNTGSYISRGCILDCGSVVDHGCILEEGIHLAAGAVVRAENQVPACTLLEANEVIAPRAFPFSERQEAAGGR